MERKLRSQRQKKIHHRLPLHVYLSYLLACTMLATGVTFSSYVTKASCSPSTARVAAGVVSVAGRSVGSLEIDCRGNIDDSVAYTFTVSNSKGEKASQVAQGYDVTVTLGKELPGGVTMTLDGKSGSRNGKKYVFSNVGTFRAGQTQSKTHELTFRADTDTLTEQVTGIQVNISVRTYQID